MKVKNKIQIKIKRRIEMQKLKDLADMYMETIISIVIIIIFFTLIILFGGLK